jgi:ribonuclease D
MSDGSLPEPILITRPPALIRLAETLRRRPVVAVDTESNSLFAYREQVCLIQFSTPEADYLVDPLAVRDLSPLADIFSNPRILKVFHAAEYDLICLRRDFGFEFANLFDTMVASRVLGWEAVGLGAILEQLFDVHLDKRFQRANWGQRPLPSALLNYARLDTHYLIAVREQLEIELDQRGLLSLADEDFRRLTIANGHSGSNNHVEIPPCWRISGSYDLEPQQAAVLVELCNYRDGVARSVNRPLFKVISDATLAEIARQTPHDRDSLSQIEGMSKGQMDRHASHLLVAVRRGLAAEPIYPPRPQRPNEDYLERVEILRRWRKQAAEAMGVKSDVVLPRDLLYDLAEANPHDLDQLSGVMQAVPWRMEHFGTQILAALVRSHA